MASGDWDKLLVQFTNCLSMEKAKELAAYCRKIPEHWVPFGHPHISLRVSAPIPIRVQCFKHKIGFVESEESRRYISSRPELYVPTCFRESAISVKQGSAGPHTHSPYWKSTYLDICQKAIKVYDDMVSQGVCPEQARFVLPQGVEVNWVWTGSLYSFANFYNLRTDTHAQLEIQDLAHSIGDIIAPLYPVSWAALTEAKY